MRELYEFSGFRLDPLRRKLFGADGRPIALKSKVFDTLLRTSGRGAGVPASPGRF